MSVCLVAMFKNESHIIKEWITHYMKQGICRFLLIDNGSNDNYIDILQPYIDKNVVELVIDPIKYSQSDCYNKYYLDKCKLFQWVIVCDLDEFIYARRGFKTIPDYLKTLHPSFSQVYIPWKMFGSNGHKEQPESVIKSFTLRSNYNIHSDLCSLRLNGIRYTYAKCIIRTKFLVKFGVHSHITSGGVHISANNRCDNINPNPDFVRIDRTILENSYLHLNHYAIQSFDWFMKVKATRGDNCSSINDNIRDEVYFKRYDTNSSSVEDRELCNLNNCG